MAEISRRIAQTARREQIELSDAASVAAYYMERLRHEPREQLILSMFDIKCRLLGDCVIATGSAHAVYGSPREIFLQLLEKRAAAFILLHNHPSGDPAPSMEDVRLTRRIRDCGTLMDITMSDHIIIGDNKYYSFRENEQILV